MKREPIGDILVGSRKGERQSTDAERKGANSDKPSASLYDDTLSGKRTKRRWVPIVWAFLGLIVVGGMVVFVTRSSGEKVAELENFEPKELDRSSPLAQVVDDVRRRPEEGTTDEGTEPQPAQGGDESVAKEVEPPPAPVPATPASPPREIPTAVARPREAVPETPKPVEPPAVKAPEQPVDQSPAATPKMASAEPVGEPEAVAEPEEEQPAAPSVSPEDQAAYDSLLDNSPEASRLVSGGYETLQFKDWRVVQRTPAEIWVDLLAAWTNGGEEVHFIWSVNRKSGTVRALSEAARNLR